MEEKGRRTKSNFLRKKIEQGIRKTGFNENFIKAVKFHLEAINAIKFEELSNITSKNEYCNLLMSKFFIDKIDMYPAKRFKCEVDECSAWPVPLLPSEVFGEAKLPVDYRKNSFYKCLQVGDILDCRVASILPNEYQLRVIHKFGTTRILDDLNLTVVLPQNNSELPLFQKELFTCELVRVAVSEIIKKENKIYVTLNINSVELKKHTPQLGRISEEHLPTYVLDPPEPELYPTYTDYLNNFPAFRNPVLSDVIWEGFGIDPRGVFSFYPVNESLKPVDGNALLKESKLNDAKQYVELALQKFESRDMINALNAVEKAIDIFPKKTHVEKDKMELSKLHEISGRICEEMEKPRMSQKAVKDWELAYKLDKKNKFVKEHLSKALFRAANKFYRDRKYKKAADVVKEVLNLNENNVEALALLSHLKERYPEAVTRDDLDQESLQALQEKKMKIVNELQKFVFNY